MTLPTALCSAVRKVTDTSKYCFWLHNKASLKNYSYMRPPASAFLITSVCLLCLNYYTIPSAQLLWE